MRDIVLPENLSVELSLLARGFLPAQDPASHFVRYPQFALLDEIGRDLPSLLMDRDFRAYVRKLDLPSWPVTATGVEDLPELRLYYLRVGFLASAYVNQVGEPPIHVLPANIAVPLCHASGLLQRPPILSYDGYALYNWKRFVPGGPIALGNIDTLQNFVHLYDEHWFILVHVEIEAAAAKLLEAMHGAFRAHASGDAPGLKRCLIVIRDALRRQIEVLRRIPEKMDPALYYKTFRPYIRFFESVVYEGVDQKPIDHRGETGAQSSIMPALVAFMKVPHKPSVLTDHLADMRHYMPAEHQSFIAEVEQMPDLREDCDRDAYNGILDAMATFREVHYGWAQQYINQWTDDPRGTGGTPYMKWLKQLIDETLGHML